AYASGATGATALASAKGIVQDGNAVARTGTAFATLGYATNVGGGGGKVPLGHLYQTLVWTTNANLVGVGGVYETVDNSGTINVAAAATAVAGTAALARATAIGV